MTSIPTCAFWERAYNYQYCFRLIHSVVDFLQFSYYRFVCMCTRFSLFLLNVGSSICFSSLHLWQCLVYIYTLWVFVQCAYVKSFRNIQFSCCGIHTVTKEIIIAIIITIIIIGIRVVVLPPLFIAQTKPRHISIIVATEIRRIRPMLVCLQRSILHS